MNTFCLWSDPQIHLQKQVMYTFLHVALQHRSVSEDQCVEDGLAGRIERPVQGNVTAGLSATVVLAINVTMDPGDEQVQTGSNGAVRGETMDYNNNRRNMAIITLLLWFVQQNEPTEQG